MYIRSPDDLDDVNEIEDRFETFYFQQRNKINSSYRLCRAIMERLFYLSMIESMCEHKVKSTIDLAFESVKLKILQQLQNRMDKEK